MSCFTLLRIPSGTYENCTVVVSDSVNHMVFIRTTSGLVYHSKKQHFINVSSDYGMNDKDRHAYAKCAGVKFVDINNYRIQVREAQQARADTDRLARFKREAEALGYEVIE